MSAQGMLYLQADIAQEENQKPSKHIEHIKHMKTSCVAVRISRSEGPLLRPRQLICRSHPRRSTEKLAFARRAAQAQPAEPAPTTTKSKSSALGRPKDAQRTPKGHRRIKEKPKTGNRKPPPMNETRTNLVAKCPTVDTNRHQINQPNPCKPTPNQAEEAPACCRRWENGLQTKFVEC